jgi:hypothetical protein
MKRKEKERNETKREKNTRGRHRHHKKRRIRRDGQKEMTKVRDVQHIYEETREQYHMRVA